MIKTYVNIDLNGNKDDPIRGMKVREIVSGKIATVTGVYELDNEVWMVIGNDIGFTQLDTFWNFFEKVKK